MNTLYLQLCAIAQQNANSLLVAYQDDLHLADRKKLEAARGRYIWVLRKTGTQLEQLQAGVNPFFITYWLEEQPKSLVFLLNADDDTVEAISHQRAVDLMHDLPPLDWVGAWDILQQQVCDLLRTFPLIGMTDVNPGRWRDWREHFRSACKPSNPVMIEVMNRAIARLDALRHAA